MMWWDYLGGSWNIIGWLLVGTFLFFVGSFLFGVGWIIYIRWRDSVRERWHKFWCARGHHGPNFHTDRERTSWYDAFSSSYIHEVTKFKRCFRCWQRIEGSEVTETRNTITEQQLRQRGPLSLTDLEVIERFKPTPPPMVTIKKGAGGGPAA